MDILKKEIRETIVSGLFYPEDKEELTVKVHELLEAEKSLHEGRDSVILSPHSSWDRCASCIAAAFAAARDFKPDRILLMGPVHRETGEQKLFLPSKKYFDSLLGLVPVEQKICRSLSKEKDLFCVDDSPHMEEHALELQLPFIQTLYPEIPIIPVLTGKLKRSSIKKAASQIKSKVLNLPGKTLIILSANLSRYALMSESENESNEILKHMDLPLDESVLELEKRKIVSSCGTVLLTLLSDLGIFSSDRKGKMKVLKRNHTEVVDKKGTMAVYYAGIRWDANQN